MYHYFIVSILVSILLSSFASFIDYETNQEEYTSAVMMMGFLSGIFLTLLGAFRMGFITRILSDTIVSSFTAASAVNIFSSQIVHFFGVKGVNGSFVKQVIHILSPSVVAQYNWYAFLIGITSSILLYTMKTLNKKYYPKMAFPTDLIVVALYIFIMWFFDLRNRWDVKYIGDWEMQSGFPPFSLPAFKYWLRLIPGSLVISIISFSSTISLAKSFARQVLFPSIFNV